MFDLLKLRLSTFLKIDNDRSKKIIKNIFLSFGVKGGSIAISLILIPMTINYISPIQYGVWLTISSVVSWMNFFDIGLGNGLRNKLATSIAKGELREARVYVSTTYAALCFISFLLVALFYLVIPILNWNQLLNIPDSIPDNISFVVLVVLCTFCIQFVFQLINTVLTAIHEPALASVISFIGQLGILVAIFFLKKYYVGSLTILAYALTIIPVLVFIISSIFLYTTRLSYLAPSIKLVNLKYVKGIMNTGGVFFVLQIGAMFLFQTSNIIITKVIGPEAVTEFNISYKLFSIIIMIFTIIITPYWSAFTDAYSKKDFEWMKINLKEVRKFWLISSFVAVPILLLSSEYLYKVWIGKAVLIPFSLSLSMSIYVITYTGMMLNCYFLNGIGKLRIQLYLYITSCIINIPLGIILTKTIGIIGVVLANTLITGIMCLILWIQCDKILNKRDKGVWSK
ncbi:lipopolysaccharide biosynthesis protein [Dyadobacter sp. 3J3]|uniref:lipopolysaccharide biosynthesis protein n=1 Tax=Dyadobacter sp. 3J3 TaxID=2606600 RepID=UPI00135A4B41|nr:oligosaccharide flippase family protein [Dyadobacter sp. 3J3]